jgi:hypothetical protein
MSRNAVKFGLKAAAALTNVAKKEVAKAWHQARDDASTDPGWRVPVFRHGDGPPILPEHVQGFLSWANRKVLGNKPKK